MKIINVEFEKSVYDWLKSQAEKNKRSMRKQVEHFIETMKEIIENEKPE